MINSKKTSYKYIFLYFVSHQTYTTNFLHDRQTKKESSIPYFSHNPSCDLSKVYDSKVPILYSNIITLTSTYTYIHNLQTTIFNNQSKTPHKQVSMY